MTSIFRNFFFACLLLLLSCRPAASDEAAASSEAEPAGSTESAMSPEVMSRVPIGNRRLQDLIELQTPGPEVEITSPLTIRGKARALWFHEGKFPIELEDEEGRLLAEIVAEGQGTATTTEDWLPFEATFTFQVSGHRRGFLVLQRANPLERSELGRSLRLPILFPAQ